MFEKMYRFVIPLILAVSTASLIDDDTFNPSQQYSAASESQIRFALENNYDDTGPGAKQPQYAYNTYKTLDEALIAFLDDPDTKLPENDRNRAIQRLYKPTTNHQKPIQRYYPKTVEEYTGYKPPEPTKPKYNHPEKIIYREPTKIGALDLHGLNGKDIFKGLKSGNYLDPFKFQRIKLVKGSPVNLAHYSRDGGLLVEHDSFDAHPKYSFSYGVQDKDTGDSKTAHETRTGGTVHGFYSFTDADGKQRTVQYTADDDQGFRATVERAHA